VLGNPVGMAPVRLLLYKYKVDSAVQLVMPDGIAPDRLFTCSNTDCNFVQLPISVGIEPERLSFESPNMTRLVKFPMVDGIEPDMPELLYMLSVTKDGKFPISDGKLPLTLLPFMLIAVTCPPLTVMPYHVLTAEAVSQFVLFVHPVPTVLLYIAINASHSVCGTPVVPVSAQLTAALAVVANNKEAANTAKKIMKKRPSGTRTVNALLLSIFIRCLYVNNIALFCEKVKCMRRDDLFLFGASDKIEV